MTAAALVFAVLLLAGMPIAVVMVMSGLAGVYTIGGFGFLSILADQMYSGVAGYILIAIPYFIFTAELMNHAGLTEQLVRFNNALFGRVRGALSHVNITVSLFFAGLTGAAITDTVAIGKILIPAMKKASLVSGPGGMPRGSLPKVNSTTFSSTMPSATVAISQAFEPRTTKGRTATRSTTTPQSAQRASARITARPMGQPSVTPKVNASTAPSIIVLPWAKFTVLETA